MKSNKMYLILAILCIWLPLFMGAWDKDKPASSTSIRSSNPQILANWSALETALAQDHEFSTGGTNSGNHEVLTMEEEASAGASSTNELHVQAIDGGSGQPEFAITSEDGNELQMTKDGDLFSSGGLVVTGTSTFNGSATLGAGDDLIGSSTSDITFNTNKFTVAGATGDTVIAGTLDVTGVATLGDASLLAAATESGDADRTIADLNYVKTGDTAMHDAEGGFSNCDVGGAKTKVYTLYLTGTLDNDASTNVAHGRADVDKILAVNVIVWNDNLSEYQHYDFYDNESADANAGYYVTFDGTNVIIQGVGTFVQGNNYRVKIDYIL